MKTSSIPFRGGYTGKVLKIDLSGNKCETEETNPRWITEYVGGASIAGRILYDDSPPGIDCYDPQSPLIIMTGPLTGTRIPGAVNFSVVAKSPLNNFAVVTNGNGQFGRYLKFAGYDGLVIKGASPSLSYLYIHNSQATIEDGSWLTRKDTYETVDLLRKKHGPDISVGCIGPAGENLIRFAGFLCDKDHSASKGGVGAILGAKKIKAIVIQAKPKEVPIADPSGLKRCLKRWKEVDDKLGLGRIVSGRGMRGFFDINYGAGTVPVKNLTTSDFPDHEQFNFDALGKHFEIRKNSCPTCDFNHFNRFIYEGEALKEPSFDTLAGYGPNIGLGDPVKAIKLLTMVDRLGFESQEASWLVSFLMECYEEGLVSRAQLDGIELTWGNYEAIIELYRRIAYRQGCGGLYAEGVYETARAFGDEGLRRAVYVKKGGVPQMMDNRNDWPFLFGEAMTNIGSRESSSNIYGVFPDGVEIGIEYPSGLEISGDPRILPRHHHLAAPRTQIQNAMGLCQLHGATNNLPLLRETFVAVTGLDLSVQDLLVSGERFLNLMRVFNLRNGLTAKDDTISPRYVTAPDRGLNAGKSFGPHLETVKRQYYAEAGWDRKGVPLLSTLRRLGLNDLIRDIP